MCCGNNRAAARAASNASNATPGADGNARAGGGDAPSFPPVSTIMFEYRGSGEASVRGPVSGQLYRFLRRGARVRVDPRDRPGLAAMPTLRWVR